MDIGFHKAHLALFGRDRLYDLVQDPLWYTKLDRFNKLRIVGAGAVGTLVRDRLVRDAAKESRERLYEMFADLLDSGEVALGKPGEGLYEWDCERMDIDTIVIHHSNRPHGISLSLLNAMELLRLYVPAYAYPVDDDKPKITGKPIYSGHFRGGRQNFFPYHWIIRQDGTSERLLEDSEWGWHAGKLSVNQSSVAICFDDDLSHKAPNEAMLAEGRRILHDEYGWLVPNNENVRAHSDFFKTECPGDQFISWKRTLLATP